MSEMQKHWDEIARGIGRYRDQVDYEPERYPPDTVDGVAEALADALRDAEGFDAERFLRTYRYPYGNPDENYRAVVDQLAAESVQFDREGRTSVRSQRSLKLRLFVAADMAGVSHSNAFKDFCQEHSRHKEEQ